MRITFLGWFILICMHGHAQIDQSKLQHDMEMVINDLSDNYAYTDSKSTDLSCIRNHYTNELSNVKNEAEAVLLFEYLLDEFYDSHLILNTNRNSSFRLYSPIYASYAEGKLIVSSVWSSQLKEVTENVIGAEIKAINGLGIEQAIDAFPTHCNDKSLPEVREWIGNKVLAGRYNEARIITLQLANKNMMELDIDQLEVRKDQHPISTKIQKDIGIIRINNRLGDNELVHAFDSTLNLLMHTKGLILDLRNTVDGGNSYVARGIMGRFVSEKSPYQKHVTEENYDGHTTIDRSWMEYVEARGAQYTKPVVVLVGRWTGSMGEGLAIGLDGMNRAEIVGTEMERLAGEMNTFQFDHRPYGYRISVAKLFHVNGTPREAFVPSNYVQQTTTLRDETLERGLSVLEGLIQESAPLSDSALKRELEQMGAEDQTLRLLLPTVTERFGRGSDEHTFIWSLIHRQDTICEKRLTQILDQYGWLGKSRVGAKANQSIWLIIQHAELETQEKYLPLLRASVENGESEGWHLAYLEDRVLMRNGKNQLYGTQSKWDDSAQKNRIHTIDDVKNVNKRRKKLGLDPVEDYAKSNGYIFDQKD